nr:hypothetical protein [Tanacetum cinerariifolium]
MTGVTDEKHLYFGTVSNGQKKKVQGCSDVDNECLDCCFVIRGDRRRCVKNERKGSVKAGGFGFGSLAVERKRYKRVALFSWSVERPLGTSLIGKRYGCQESKAVELEKTLDVTKVDNECLDCCFMIRGDRRRCAKNERKGSVKAGGFGFGSLAVERKRYKRVALFSWSVERPLGTSLIGKRYGCQGFGRLNLRLWYYKLAHQKAREEMELWAWKRANLNKGMRAKSWRGAGVGFGRLNLRLWYYKLAHQKAREEMELWAWKRANLNKGMRAKSWRGAGVGFGRLNLRLWYYKLAHQKAREEMELWAWKRANLNKVLRRGGWFFYFGGRILQKKVGDCLV